MMTNDTRLDYGQKTYRSTRDFCPLSARLLDIELFAVFCQPFQVLASLERIDAVVNQKLRRSYLAYRYSPHHHVYSRFPSIKQGKPLQEVLREIGAVSSENPSGLPRSSNALTK